MRRAAAMLGVVAAAAGCGDGASAPAGSRSARLVDFAKKPPYVNALDVDPATRDFLLTTNRGFFRIDPDTDGVRRVRATVSAQGRTSTVGTFLELVASGPGRLLGSGHPDRPGALPSFLGLIASTDGGRTWTVRSRLGDADLHKIVLTHRRLYAFDAVLGAILISTDGGRTFVENFTPRGLIIDFEVDPANADRIVAANERELFRSEDAGKRWRAILVRPGVRLSWPAADRLLRADRDGTVSVSADGGSTWKALGRVPGEPYKFKSVSVDELYLALSDGTILHTTDGGKRWQIAFEP